MGQSTKELRRRINAVGNIRKITRAMEMVAATKLRRLQLRAEGAHPYASAIRRVSAQLSSASSGSGEVRSPLTERRDPVRRVGILVISSDRGLCGAYNANLFKQAMQLVSELGSSTLMEAGSGPEVVIYTLGRKARSYFRRRMRVVEAYPDEVEKLGYRRIAAIASELSEEFAAGAKGYRAPKGHSATSHPIDELWVVYSRFDSATRQAATAERLLPIDPRILEGEAQASQGEAAKGAGAEGGAEGVGDILLEPSAEDLLVHLLPKSVSMRLYAAQMDALASEYAARRMAMKAATDAAGDIISALRRDYNKARQSGITSELLDIVGGAEALK